MDSNNYAKVTGVTALEDHSTIYSDFLQTSPDLGYLHKTPVARGRSSTNIMQAAWVHFRRRFLPSKAQADGFNRGDKRQQFNNGFAFLNPYVCSTNDTTDVANHNTYTKIKGLVAEPFWARSFGLELSSAGDAEPERRQAASGAGQDEPAPRIAAAASVLQGLLDAAGVTAEGTFMDVDNLS